MKKLIMILTVIAIIACSYLFSKTKGLAYPTGDGFVSQSMSCDSDDDVCIQIGKILFIPFLIFAFTIKRKIYIWEFILGNVILFFQLVVLMLIEGGSIFKTIMLGNIPLLCWLVSYISLFIELYCFFMRERKNLKFYNHFVRVKNE